MTARNPYEVLGVKPLASEREIHAVYRQLAKRFHPDLNPDNPSAEARFKEVAEAYATLSHERRGRSCGRDAATGGTERPERPQSHSSSSEWGDATTRHPRAKRSDADTSKRGFGTARNGEAEHRNDASHAHRFRDRKRTTFNKWFVALAVWMLLSWGNGLIRGIATELDGVIVAAKVVRLPAGHSLILWGGLWDRSTNEFTIRRADWREQTFIAGPACSLLSAMPSPRTGTRIHKQAWQLSYEMNGRSVSDFSLAPSCAMGGALHLFISLSLLTIGLRWPS